MVLLQETLPECLPSYLWELEDVTLTSNLMMRDSASVGWDRQTSGEHWCTL